MKKKILVVDDDRLMLKFVTNLLEREGHEVLTAGDGFTALNLLTSFFPDVMLFDLIMPKIDGDKLCQIVRQMPHMKDCYLVIVSAAVAELDVNYTEIGADEYIAKGPFDAMAEHILAAIRASDSPRQEGKPKPIQGLESVYARQLTKELLSRNRHLETILESMSEGILEVFSGKIVYANSAALNLFELPQERLLAAYPPDLFEGQDHTRLHTLLRSEDSNSREIGVNRPIELNGRQVTIKKLPVKDSPSTTIILIRDVTEHRQLELQLQHAQKMEAIGTIASGVAHNFRNTLTEILVNSQVIQTNYKNEAGLHELAERINKSVRRGARLVDGLLQFSRKQIKKEFQPLNLSALIRETTDIVKKSFENQIEIRTKMPESLPILGDHAALSHALMNLCTNARDAMPNGGELRIEARQEENQAIITVSDSGHGMDQETQEKCFDPFFTTKAIGQGTGLGLSTAYGIVQSHEGRIRVTSAPQRGATFRVYLPLAPSGKRRQQTSDREIVRGNGECILVVDVEVAILQALQDLLSGLGYKPIPAENGKQALDQYKLLRPEAVLMDVNLPDMTGFNCAEKIMAYDPAAKVALISGYEPGAVNDEKPQMQGSIVGYLTKPIDLVDLSGLLARLVRGQP
ncbi:MAG: response regulator [Desulfobacterales bacterium]|nr:MAG: response regulator [Desulfobacterales bacterium]